VLNQAPCQEDVVGSGGVAQRLQFSILENARNWRQVQATHLHLVPRSKYAWSYTSTPQYIFTTWCLLKHRDNFTFIVYLICTSLPWIYSSLRFISISFLMAFQTTQFWIFLNKLIHIYVACWFLRMLTHLHSGADQPHDNATIHSDKHWASFKSKICILLRCYILQCFVIHNFLTRITATMAPIINF
jgi:hypothetical protein